MYGRIFLAVGLFVFSISYRAYACSSIPGVPEPTLEEKFAKASAVFVAHVTRVEETSAQVAGRSEAIVEGTFRLVEVLKGQPPEDQKIKSFVFGPGNCTLPMLAGMDYLFFLPTADSLISWPDGSQFFWNVKETGPQRLLTKLRALKSENLR